MWRVDGTLIEGGTGLGPYDGQLNISNVYFAGKLVWREYNLKGSSTPGTS